ncbi:MAG: hypothetical protein A2901_00850 [Elusimicrobia bacterium RIFCSPLOWO2_01_FULL_54_10]|nr:MAG: hypothetical protein A2901_00850 [Elusimicrobia bacterium RIFCSPLOWO2_01_FULL_54_10]
MEEKSQGGEESKSCCGSNCSCCGGRRGGCTKVIGAIVLILLGWMAGFIMANGGLCGKKGMYSHSGAMSCPMTQSAPAAPAAK